jgi:hypothetical protein
MAAPKKPNTEAARAASLAVREAKTRQRKIDAAAALLREARLSSRERRLN